MLKKANLPLSAKQIVKMMEKGTVTFDNVVQRGLTWELKRKSLLIHSMITGYPIPPFYSARTEIVIDGKTEKGYDMLDGKQRSHAIYGFMKGEYKLTNVPEVITEDGEIVDISGMKYDELPEELQDAIKDYSLTIYYFEDITQDEIVEMFSRLNNGKPLTAIELTRVKAKANNEIKEISNHEIFKDVMSEKQLSGFKHEDIVIKSWVVMYNKNKSLETKHIRPLVEDTMEIKPDQINEMNEVYERLQEVHDNILLNDTSNLAKKIAKRIYTMTHLISLTPITLKSIKDGMDIEEFTSLVKEFFSPEDVATISTTYNDYISAGANKKESVENRLKCLMNHYNKKDVNDISETVLEDLVINTGINTSEEVVSEEVTNEEVVNE